MAAYASASGNKIQQRENVKATLKRLKLEIMTMNAKAPFWKERTMDDNDYLGDINYFYEIVNKYKNIVNDSYA